MEVNKIYHGKMEEVLKNFPDNCCDSIVTDPPYGLKFMGMHWDYKVPSVQEWTEAIRVLKPGGFLLSFGGTRTYHRMVVNIEDAGFEIRDQIQWLYGSGFPKSLDISQAIDKLAGVEREVIGIGKSGKTRNIMDAALHPESFGGDYNVSSPSTEAAKQWEGWGTALKPANEPICVARKPVEGTVANNVLKYGTGGLNIDGCRIETDDKINEISGGVKRRAELNKSQGFRDYKDNICTSDREEDIYKPSPLGRFPANVILDEFMGAELDKQSEIENVASRFFYCPKPDNFERNKGLKNFELKPSGIISNTSGQHITRRDGGAPPPKANYHPTVKPIDLMRYLVKLVTPKGGICLDPFCGSGTTLIAAKMELINWVGIDIDVDHIPLAEARVKAWNPDLYIAQELFK